jgi:tRNA splicing ligase
MTIQQLRDGLAQVREFVRRNQYPPEIERYFIRRRWENLVLLNYTDAVVYEFGADDWTPPMRVCRGVILTNDGSQIVSFPFQKFFNVGEGSETRPNEVARWTVRAVTEKIDGVMIQIFRWKGELVWASRHGIWSNAATDAFKVASDAVEKIFPQRATGR